MVNQLSWKVGGQQGEGIDSTGEIFATALNRMGYYLFSYRHFSSRIKGGHTSYKIRVTTTPKRAIPEETNILVAFDQETIDVNFNELSDGAVIIADSKFNPHIDREDINLYSIPLSEIAENLGNILMKNMVAIGATSYFLNLPLGIYTEILSNIFSRKGKEVIDINLSALNQGAKYFENIIKKPNKEFHLNNADGKTRMFMSGNQAITLGSIAAGVRFVAAYPITPASEIMEYLSKKLPEIGGVVIQTEDEISAATMAIGASYGGVRSLTSTSGPGLSLMQEAIGLAGMTEIPLVVVDVQRSGPSTGLSTKIEQGDFNAAIFGNHGDIPKIVLVPNSIEDTFYDTVQAFNLADEYQCPVIILTDLVLGMGKQTVEPPDYEKIFINRGKYLGDDVLPELNSNLFNRYLFTEDGISPRVIPGQKNGIHHVTGIEHKEDGTPFENKDNRKKMMEKRLNKIKNISFNNPVLKSTAYKDDYFLIIGIGSTRGAITEAIELLINDGYKVNQAHIRLLLPFPKEELNDISKNAKKIIVIENNGTGQIANYIKMNLGLLDKIINLLKYDGNPFLSTEIYKRCRGIIDGNN